MDAIGNIHSWVVTKIYLSSQYKSESIRNLILSGNTDPVKLSNIWINFPLSNFTLTTNNQDAVVSAVEFR